MAVIINGSGTITGISVGGLPDGIVDTDMLAANAVTAAKASGSVKGITQADEWRVNSSFTANDTYLVSNWERNDTDFSLIGSGMTESSGHFSFPATGIYSVKFSLGVYRNSATQVRYVGAFIYATTNDSSYYTRGQSYSSISSDDIANTAVHAQMLFDVQNTSTHKVKFRLLSEHDVTCRTETDKNDTHVTFIRLGDT
jgi:hypothetical protein